jgi:hypothetical protein
VTAALVDSRSLFFRLTASWRVFPATPITSSSAFEEMPYAKKYR